MQYCLDFNICIFKKHQCRNYRFILTRLQSKKQRQFCYFSFLKENSEPTTNIKRTRMQFCTTKSIFPSINGFPCLAVDSLVFSSRFSLSDWQSSSSYFCRIKLTVFSLSWGNSPLYFRNVLAALYSEAYFPISYLWTAEYFMYFPRLLETFLSASFADPWSSTPSPVSELEGCVYE